MIDPIPPPPLVRPTAWAAEPGELTVLQPRRAMVRSGQFAHSRLLGDEARGRGTQSGEIMEAGDATSLSRAAAAVANRAAGTICGERAGS